MEKKLWIFVFVSSCVIEQILNDFHENLAATICCIFFFVVDKMLPESLNKIATNE